LEPDYPEWLLESAMLEGLVVATFLRTEVKYRLADTAGRNYLYFQTQGKQTLATINRYLAILHNRPKMHAALPSNAN
jgi:hypothetical protein